MPTKKPRPGVIFSDEEIDRLHALLLHLKLARKVPQPLTLNRFVARLALERASQIEEPKKKR